MTLRKDSEVFAMPAVEFFAWVAYAKRKVQKQEEQLRQFKAKHNG